MTLAGLSPAGALIVRAGEPFALQVGYVDESGDLQDLTGRTFALAIRYSDQTTPLLTIHAELDALAVTAVALGTADQASLIYAAGIARSLSYDFMELTGGATGSRLTERVTVQPGSEIPGDLVPQYMDLPLLSVTVATQRKLVIERGRPGFGAERRLYDAGLIDEPTVEAMDERYLQAGATGAQPFAERAELARDLAVAAEEQTGLDRDQTGQDVLATAAARAQAEAAAQSAMLSGNIYPTKAAGEAATANGQQFVAYGPDDNYATRYLMVAGAGQAQDAYPNRTALDTAVAAFADVAYQITERQQLGDPGGIAPLLDDDLIFAVPGAETGLAVTRSGDMYARMPHHLGGPILSDTWKEVVAADKDGNPAIVIDIDDVVRFRQAMPVLSDSYKYVEVTEDGTVIWAITIDDEIIWGGAPPVAAISDWSATARDGRVWVGKDGTAMVSLSDAAGFPSDPILSGNMVAWTEFGSGAGVAMEASLTGVSQYAIAVATVKHMLTYGQSTSRGIVLPIETIGAPVLGRLKMFSQGVSASSNVALTSASFATLADAALTNAEVPVLSAARQYLSDRPASIGVLVSGHGVGSYSYDQLKKGTVPYANMVTAIRAAARQHTLAGLNYEVEYLSWLHGQANSGMATGAYLLCLEQIQADLTNDYQMIVATDKPVVFVTSQVSNFTAYSLPTVPPMSLELLEAALLYPDRFVCAGPEYPAEYHDGTHFTSAGSLYIGELHGRAMRLHREGLYTGPLYVLLAARTDAIVILTFNEPYGAAAIDLDTSIVSDPGNYGVTFHQTGGNAVTVTHVAEGPGDFQLTITLSATPTGTDQKIGIAATGTPGQPAGPTTGGRSCIRSAVAETDAEGRALDHYACHQFIAIS